MLRMLIHITYITITLHYTITLINITKHIKSATQVSAYVTDRMALISIMDTFDISNKQKLFFLH